MFLKLKVNTSKLHVSETKRHVFQNFSDINSPMIGLVTQVAKPTIGELISENLFVTSPETDRSEN